MDSVIDMLGVDQTSRTAIRTAVEKWGPRVIESILPHLLTDMRNTQYIASLKTKKVMGNNLLLSESFAPKPIHLRDGLPGDVAPEAAKYVAHLISRRYAPGTLKSRASNFRTIVTTAVGLDVCPYPMSVGAALSIFAQFAYEGRSFKLIAAMRDTVVMLHSAGTYPDPTKDRVFKQMFEGIRREIGVQNQNRKIALYRDEVGDMIAIAREIGRDDLATMIAVIFEGALRCSECLNLEMRDIIRRDGRIWINLRISKTDQGGAGALVELRRVPGATFDVVTLLEAWIAKRGPAPGPLFPSVHGINMKRKRRGFARRLKALAAVVGRKYDFLASDVSTHSLRAGYVTTEIDKVCGPNERRFSVAEVAAHLRHKSIDTLLVYYRPRGCRPNFVATASRGAV